MSNQECAITDERAAAKDSLQFCFEEFHSYAYYSSTTSQWYGIVVWICILLLYQLVVRARTTHTCIMYAYAYAYYQTTGSMHKVHWDTILWIYELVILRAYYAYSMHTCYCWQYVCIQHYNITVQHTDIMNTVN